MVVSPPGDPILIHVRPFNINNSEPGDAKFQAIVAGLRNGEPAAPGESNWSALKYGSAAP